MIQFFKREWSQYEALLADDTSRQSGVSAEEYISGTSVWKDGIYFITDKNILMVGNVEYGRTPSTESTEINEQTFETISGYLTTVGAVSGFVDDKLSGILQSLEAIRQQIGTNESGETLGERVANIENSINYTVLSGENDSLLENIGTVESPDYRLRAKYNPGITLQMKGTEVEKNATTINFIGNCMVVTDGNGYVVTRIGDNLNSSNFNTSDGQTVGTASSTMASTGSATPGSDLDGSSTTYTKTGGETITTAGLIHFDNNVSTTFELDVFVGKSGEKTTYTFGPITGNGTYQSGTTGISLTIANFGTEAKTEEGATGYQGKPTIALTNAAIESIAQNQDIWFAVRHINGSEGTKTYGPTSKTFVITDDTTKPSVTGVTCSLASTSTKKCSGIEYITAGTVTITATGIQNLANPAYVNQKLAVASTGGNWFTDYAVNGTTGLTGFNGSTSDSVSYSGTTTAIQTGYWTAAGASVAGVNVNGTGTAVTSTTSIYNIDKSTDGNPTVLIEYFKDETQRLTTDTSASYDSNASISGTQDLMVTCGKLKYPAASEFGQSFNQTDERYFVRAFTIGGTVNSVKFTISGSNISTNTGNGKLTFEVMNKQDTLYGATWKNVTFGQSGSVYVGADTTFAASTGTINVTFGNGGAAGVVYLRVKMQPGCTALIDTITCA